MNATNGFWFCCRTIVSAVAKGKGKRKAILDDGGDGADAEEEEEEEEQEEDIAQKAREMAEMCRQQEEEDRQDFAVCCITDGVYFV